MVIEPHLLLINDLVMRKGTVANTHEIETEIGIIEIEIAVEKVLNETVTEIETGRKIRSERVVLIIETHETDEMMMIAAHGRKADIVEVEAILVADDRFTLNV